VRLGRDVSHTSRAARPLRPVARRRARCVRGGSTVRSSPELRESSTLNHPAPRRCAADHRQRRPHRRCTRGRARGAFHARRFFACQRGPISASSHLDPLPRRSPAAGKVGPGASAGPIEHSPCSRRARRRFVRPARHVRGDSSESSASSALASVTGSRSMRTSSRCTRTVWVTFSVSPGRSETASRSRSRHRWWVGGARSRRRCCRSPTDRDRGRASRPARSCPCRRRGRRPRRTARA
jgi:hypothetical protein